MDLKIPQNSSFSYFSLFFNFGQLLLKITYIKWGKYDKYISLEYFYEKKSKNIFQNFFWPFLKNVKKITLRGAPTTSVWDFFYLFLCFLVKSNNYSPVLT